MHSLPSKQGLQSLRAVGEAQKGCGAERGHTCFCSGRFLSNLQSSTRLLGSGGSLRCCPFSTGSLAFPSLLNPCAWTGWHSPWAEAERRISAPPGLQLDCAGDLGNGPQHRGDCHVRSVVAMEKERLKERGSGPWACSQCFAVPFDSCFASDSDVLSLLYFTWPKCSGLGPFALYYYPILKNHLLSKPAEQLAIHVCHFHRPCELGHDCSTNRTAPFRLEKKVSKEAKALCQAANKASLLLPPLAQDKVTVWGQLNGSAEWFRKARGRIMASTAMPGLGPVS